MYLMRYVVDLWSSFAEDIKGLLVLGEWSSIGNRNILRNVGSHIWLKVPWDENSLEEHLGKVLYMCNLCLALPLSYSFIWQQWRQYASPAFGLTWLNWSQFCMLCPDLVNKKQRDLEVDFEYDFVGFCHAERLLDVWTTINTVRLKVGGHIAGL